MTSVRAYRPEDRAAKARVFFRAVHEGAAQFYDPAQRAAWAPSPEPDWNEPDRQMDQWCWVAETDGALTGFMSLERDGYLDMAFVVPEAMGTGVAQALYRTLEDHARQNGLRRLTVRASHLARHFFEKQGWTIDRFEAFPLADQVFDTFQMSLDLEADR
ncbi:GNAT family N-acetyltransferase [Defluviimonas sp. WL0002]|uniref:GNAT family N-acetyltransferase n=1 Tax=Albidovulum marisflavi TaxID=2984159 RepID=A0ABT2ZFE0_9RHOB|nr:GNAT family N-acetyltransferase [Defluviimonas sp. WL0002]MCV2869748.1 GNAT family N-acetyltransferase [Defluviimonas sp. WL0002]